MFRKKVDEKEEKMRREEEAGMKELDKDNKRLQKLRKVNIVGSTAIPGHTMKQCSTKSTAVYRVVKTLFGRLVKY